MNEDAHEPGSGQIAARHGRWGWASLAVFALLGLVLESLHGFKLGAYLDHETRRSMWRLAHAHGALLGLVHLAFAASSRARLQAASLRRVSLALCLASVCMPLGFLLGGLWFHGADPGLGIVLVPIGGVALIYACLRLAWAGSSAAAD